MQTNISVDSAAGRSRPQLITNMLSTRATRSFIMLTILVLVALCGVQAGNGCAISGTISPGDEIDNAVMLDSLEPVDEAVAFGGPSRRLLQCRKCSCLPRCSRCLIHSCASGTCNGLCRMPQPGYKCSILRCSRTE